MAGLQAKLQPALKAAGVIKADVLSSLLAPVQGTAVKALNSISAVRDAAEMSLNSFFGLLLDNTQELRKTLQDGNAVIELVRTLRGAECEEATFEPPTQKPATIKGPSGKLTISTGSCALKRTADPLKEEFKLECVEPGVELEAKVPRYTSRFVTAAKATTEECKVERKYGVESETVITLFNPADFITAAAEEEDEGAEGDADEADVDVDADAFGGRNGTAAAGGLGVNRAAGWFKTLFPLKGKLRGAEGKRGRVRFMPQGVMEAVQKAIQKSTIELTLDYKPFTIKQDMIKAASNVAEALSQSFEVKQKLFKVYKDDIADWANPEKRAEFMQEVNFEGNLRESMAKYNVTSLFDGMFAKTASSLMAKTRLGSKVGGLAERLATEKPLRTLLSRAREGAGQPVELKIEAGLTDALSQAMGVLKTASDANPLSQLLQAPRKGSLMELLTRNKGTRGHLQELGKIFDNMGALSAQLGALRQGSGDAAAAPADSSAGAAAEASAAAPAEASSAAADSADTTDSPDTTDSTDSADNADSSDTTDSP